MKIMKVQHQLLTPRLEYEKLMLCTKNFQLAFNGDVYIQIVVALGSPFCIALDDILIRFVLLQSVQLIIVF